jgi:hypothetical protein
MKPPAFLALTAVFSVALAAPGCGADSQGAHPAAPTSPASASASSAPASPAPAITASAADQAAIRQTALDYIEGWYAGDGDRMARALHPDLAKRMVHPDGAGKSVLDQMGAEKLVQGTRRGFGKDTPPARQQKDVTILDVFGGAASVKIVASDWIDYLHMARFDGRWVIINVLWELKPGAR